MRASSKRLGSITVAVNRSPMRESLLDKVSLIRTLRSVPAGTSGAAARLVVVFFFRPGFVWAKANGASPRTRLKTSSVRNIFLILSSKKFSAKHGVADTHCGVGKQSIDFAFELPFAMDRTIRVEDVRRRRLSHDDVLQTH